MTDFVYNSNEYERQAQRFVLSLYIKGELGYFEFSSTGTFIKYRNFFFIVGAYHAIEKSSIENLYWIDTDGEAHQLIENSLDYKLFKEQDVFIINFMNAKYDGKNYFDLDYEIAENILSENFDIRNFYWLGFPKNWQKVSRKSKNYNPEEFKKKYIHIQGEETYRSSNKYFLLPCELINNSNTIEGFAPQGRAKFKYGGEKDIPKLEGMSGGAFFIPTKNAKILENNSEPSIKDSYIFLGIGLERRELIKDDLPSDTTQDDFKQLKRGRCIVSGLSRYELIKLIDLYLEERPPTLIPYPQDTLIPT